MSADRRVVVVSSGLGPRCGGVGVVSAMALRALEHEFVVTLCTNRLDFPRSARLAALSLEIVWAVRKRITGVFYEHVDLAQIHQLVPRLRSTPYAVFLHGTEVWRPVEGLRRRALERARTLMVNSAYTARRALEANPWLPRLTVVPLGVDEPEPIQAFKEPVALLLGRMSSAERYKGHDQTLDAWPEVSKRVPRARLVIVGTGDDRERLERRVRDECLTGVTFTGWLSEKQRSEQLASASCLVLASRNEGFGLAALDAAVLGTATIALKGSSLEEVFPSNAASFVERQTGRDLAPAIIELLADVDAAKRLGDAAKQHVMQGFLAHDFESRFREAWATSMLEG